MGKKIMKILGITLAALAGVFAAIFGVIYFSNSGEFVILPTTVDDKSLPVIEIDGYKFHGETFGDFKKPVVIILHGGPGGDYKYILPLAELSDDYFVVFYDQRGSGLSPRVDESELNVEQYIRDLDGIVERFSLGAPVHLIGHSWGAMLASLYIGRYPEKVGKTVLAEPGLLDHETWTVFNEMTNLNDVKITKAVLSTMISSFGESLHVDSPDDQGRNDYFVNRFFTSPLAENPLAGYYPEDNIENASGDYWRFGAAANKFVQLSGIGEDGRMMDLAAGVDVWSGTALFISGSENSIIGPDYQRNQMNRFPRATLEIIQGAGHTMIGEKPVETLKVIRSYLENN